MNATVTYVMSFVPHPWNEERRAEGVKAWCLMKVVTPELGNATHEAVAIFNFDSEAQTFAGHVTAAGLDVRLVDVGQDFRELFEVMRRRR